MFNKGAPLIEFLAAVLLLRFFITYCPQIYIYIFYNFFAVHKNALSLREFHNCAGAAPAGEKKIQLFLLDTLILKNLILARPKNIFVKKLFLLLYSQIQA